MDKLTNMIRLILIALIVGSEAASVGPTQYLTEEPSDVTATTGDKVRLNCQVDNRQGTCQWTRDGFGRRSQIACSHIQGKAECINCFDTKRATNCEYGKG